nr:extensin-like [Lolium perenne]
MESDTGRGQEAGNSGQGSGAKERFPRIAAEKRGPCRKRALDTVDPDPYVHWTDLKMGRTHTSRPGPGHATPLQAEVGREFLEKLTSQGKKKKAPASEAGPSEAPPAKRPRQEVVGGKTVSKKQYKKRQMLPCAQALQERQRHEAGELRGSRKDLTSSSLKPGSAPGQDAPDARSSPKTMPAPPPEAPTGEPTGPKPTPPPSKGPTAAELMPPPSQGPTAAKPPPPEGTKPLKPEPSKAKATASGTPTSGPQPLVLHAGRAAIVAGETASGQLGQITELACGGNELGHLLEYIEKWN